MEWTGLNELREKYLLFFESKGHLRLKSFSLVPQNDNSLLLINSGMAPMKKFFTGEITPPRKRVTTCQKCIRTPDIERVGKTARHGTYFEMLGNFSFGDYFKREATAWAWEFFTEVLQMPKDRLWVSIYENDDEAFDIWTKEVGVDPARVVRLGKEDNFWEHGSGPCGPCSEIYFDRGEQYGCGSASCGVGCDCDRYVEVWNLVFTQFDSDGKGNYAPLEHPNIDTGMGLERLACVMQGVENLFEVDTVQNIMKHVGRIAGVQYGDDEKTDVSLRVVTDHIRSTTFMIGDGVMPSNEGRGYVLRRLLRRAARHGRLLGIDKPFLAEVSATVIHENRDAYPELAEKQEFIQKLIAVEEESFGRTIDQGLQLLDELMKNAKDKKISGQDAFRLYDTFGFPLDLTVDILEEKGMSTDEEAFNRLMSEQKTRARAARKNAGMEAWEGEENPLAGLPATAFTGYETLVCPVTLLAIVKDGETCTSLGDGAKAVLVCDQSCAYAESGGQVGDTGVIQFSRGSFRIDNTTKNHDGVFLLAGVCEGDVSLSEKGTMEVLASRRRAIMRNHSAAHLLQAALRKVLGNHVQQAGSYVDDQRCRFDFTHFSALTADELQAVEEEVNRNILAALPMTATEMPIEEAKKLGAMALFGEKYGDIVRVVRAGEVSTEFCGGTHVDNTAKIGLFHIVSESSVAAGVRRIEGVTGLGVLRLIAHQDALLQKSAAACKAGNPEELPQKIGALQQETRVLEKELEQLKAQNAAGKTQELLASAKPCGSVKLIVFKMKGEAGEARAVCDSVKQELEDGVAVIAAVSPEKGNVTFAVSCGKAAVEKGANAGNIVRQVAAVAGGKGGGRPDSAMAGGKDPSKTEEALHAAYAIVEEMTK